MSRINPNSRFAAGQSALLRMEEEIYLFLNRLFGVVYFEFPSRKWARRAEQEPPARRSISSDPPLTLRNSLGQCCLVMKGILPLLFATAALAISAHAQNATTTPVGAMTVTIAAGTGVGKVMTSLSVPLEEPSTASGLTVGRITSVAAGSVSNSAGGWTQGQLSLAANPTLLRITSGTAAGRTFLISTTVPNTTDTITIDSSDLGATDLRSLGILTGPDGDTYELLEGHTLATLFGTDSSNGVQASSAASTADQVVLFVSGQLRTFYLNNASTPVWRRIGPNTASNNVVVKPETGVFYSRLANTPLQLTFLGRVPTIGRKVSVKDSGETSCSVGWAADTTISELGLTSLPSWTSGSASTGDTLKFLVSGQFRTYYFNGTNWRRVGPNTISDSVAIPAGSTYIIRQLGAASSSSILTQSPPYSL